ncbi:MAG: hypothetical protein R6V35_05850 [Candidatus Nanohaloarchaea archaeon]
MEDWTDISETLDEDRISRGVGEAEKIIEGLDVDENYTIKPYTDFDGPVRTRESGGDTYHEGVGEAFDLLVEDVNILNPGIISGRGLGFLLGQFEELGLREIDVAGEMGAAYFTQGQFEGGLPDVKDFQYAIDWEDQDSFEIYDFNLTLFEHLADQDLQFMYGDNISNIIGSACVEAFGANLDEDRFSVEDTVYADLYDYANSQGVQDEIKAYTQGEARDRHEDLFEFHNDMIRFVKSREAAEILTDVFAVNPFIPWGFHDEGDRIAMFPEYRADQDFTQQDFEDFVTGIVEDFNEDSDSKFWASTYHDHSFDYGPKGYENMKTAAAEAILDYSQEEILAANTGYKHTDILQMPNSLFLAQIGTEV